MDAALETKTIALKETDSAHLSRYLVEATYSEALSKRYESEVMEASAEISDLQRRLEYFNRRLEILQSDLVSAKATYSRAVSMLDSIKSRVVKEAGLSSDSPDDFIFSTTPNGTVTSLTLKEN